MFCTNCGEKIGFRKVCKKCGYNIKRGKKYCAYCGISKDEEADICINCGQKRYSSKFNFIKYILFIITLIVSYSFLVIYLEDKELVLLFICLSILLLAISFLPIWTNMIKAKTTQNKLMKVILSIFKSVCIPIIALAITIYGAVNSSIGWTAKEASDYAIEAYFNTHLKNPSSLQIHDYKVTYSEDIIDDKVTVWVKYDYSAQNSLGGYNRDNITITLLYDTENDSFSFVSAN